MKKFNLLIHILRWSWKVHLFTTSSCCFQPPMPCFIKGPKELTNSQGDSKNNRLNGHQLFSSTWTFEKYSWVRSSLPQRLSGHPSQGSRFLTYSVTHFSVFEYNVFNAQYLLSLNLAEQKRYSRQRKTAWTQTQRLDTMTGQRSSNGGSKSR